MAWAAAAVAAVAGIASYAAQSSANGRAQALQSDALQKWIALQIPDPAEQRIVLQKFVNQGTIDPRLESAIKQDPTQFNQIFTSATQKNSQVRALKELEDIGYQGGLRLQDKAALQQATSQGNVQDRANRAAITDEMAHRGLGGSGYEVAAQLQGQQAGADRDARSRLQVASDAQQRALAAIEGAGNLATQYRTQDFGEQAAKASAADRINQFNTQNARDVNSTNTAYQNRAQELNLANAQDIANKNTTLSNSQELYNKGLAQQKFDNQTKQLAGATGQYNTAAGTEQKGGEILGNTISNIGGAGANAIGTNAKYDFWNNYFDSQKKKKAIQDDGTFDGMS
jgi:hypothetical protein